MPIFSSESNLESSWIKANNFSDEKTPWLCEDGLTGTDYSVFYWWFCCCIQRAWATDITVLFENKWKTKIRLKFSDAELWEFCQVDIYFGKRLSAGNFLENQPKSADLYFFLTYGCQDRKGTLDQLLLKSLDTFMVTFALSSFSIETSITARTFWYFPFLRFTFYALQQRANVSCESFGIFPHSLLLVVNFVDSCSLLQASESIFNSKFPIWHTELSQLWRAEAFCRAECGQFLCVNA